MVDQTYYHKRSGIDIVQKDKKQHAQKMKNKYQQDRKNTLDKKFQVLKGDSNQAPNKKDILKNQLQKDNLISNEFRRLAEQKKHVNLFEHEQKIIQNEELLEYNKMKQSEYLKGKQLDYSSKFLGTYNDRSKMPWYVKQKYVQNKKSKQTYQRYDMEDLTDKYRIDKLKNRQYNHDNIQKIEKNFGKIQQVHQTKVKKQDLNQDEIIRQQRNRTRQRKYQFLKHNINTQQKFTFKPTQTILAKQTLLNKPTVHKQESLQMQQLRVKRLKRQEKQRRRVQQLKKRMSLDCE